MKVMVWVAPGTWPAAVAAAAERPAGDEIVLVAAANEHDVAPGPPGGGLFGRGRRPHHAEAPKLAESEAGALLQQAAQALGRPCGTQVVNGPSERALTAAAADADWLIIARDADRSRLGPHSLSRQARFVIDHSAATVQLIWPESSPDLGTIPPPPAH